MFYRATKDIITDKNIALVVSACACVGICVSTKSLCGQPPDGVFVFVAVCAEGREVMVNCVPHPPLPLFSLPLFSLSFIQIKFLMGFIGATVE